MHRYEKIMLTPLVMASPELGLTCNARKVKYTLVYSVSLLFKP